MNFGGVIEEVMTREEFPLDKAREILKDETIAVIGYGVQGPGQVLVTDFNDNLSLSLNLSSIPLGDLFMGTVHDSASGRYYPTVMMRSSLTGGEDVPLTTMLRKLGIDIPDILQTVAQFDE